MKENEVLLAVAHDEAQTRFDIRIMIIVDTWISKPFISFHFHFIKLPPYY